MLEQFNNAFTFFVGSDNVIEEMLWSDYARMQGKETQNRSSNWVKIEGVEMWKRAEVTLATALSIRGIEQIVRPLPYQISVPSNKVTFEGNLATQSVSSGQEFFAKILPALFGVEFSNGSKADVAIVVDPDLMYTADFKTILGSTAKILVIKRRYAKIPPTLQTLLNKAESEVFISEVDAPFVQPELEEALVEMKGSTFYVCGDGKRLVPTIIGVLDVYLNSIRWEGEMKFVDRRAAIRQAVTVNPTGFDVSWYDNAASTVADAFTDYLTYWGFNTDPVTEDYPTERAFYIRPRTILI